LQADDALGEERALGDDGYSLGVLFRGDRVPMRWRQNLRLRWSISSVNSLYVQERVGRLCDGW